MVCRVFFIFISLIFSLGPAGAESSDSLRLRGIVFKSIQVSMSPSFETRGDSGGLKIESNMARGTYKIYHQDKGLVFNKRKYRRLVVEAN